MSLFSASALVNALVRPVPRTIDDFAQKDKDSHLRKVVEETPSKSGTLVVGEREFELKSRLQKLQPATVNYSAAQVFIDTNTNDARIKLADHSTVQVCTDTKSAYITPTNCNKVVFNLTDEATYAKRIIKFPTT